MRGRYDLDELARWMNPFLVGWMTYYGRFYRSQLYPLLRFKAWWAGLLDRDPGLFKHWAWERQFSWKG